MMGFNSFDEWKKFYDFQKSEKDKESDKKKFTWKGFFLTWLVLGVAVPWVLFASVFAINMAKHYAALFN